MERKGRPLASREVPPPKRGHHLFSLLISSPPFLAMGVLSANPLTTCIKTQREDHGGALQRGGGGRIPRKGDEISGGGNPSSNGGIRGGQGISLLLLFSPPSPIPDPMDSMPPPHHLLSCTEKEFWRPPKLAGRGRSVWEAFPFPILDSEENPGFGGTKPKYFFQSAYTAIKSEYRCFSLEETTHTMKNNH